MILCPLPPTQLICRRCYSLLFYSLLHSPPYEHQHRSWRLCSQCIPKFQPWTHLFLRAPKTMTFLLSILPATILWFVYFELHIMSLFLPHQLIFHYICIFLCLSLFLESHAKWIFCSVPGVPSPQLIFFYCTRLKSDPHLNTTVTCGVLLRLFCLPFLIEFKERPSGWLKNLHWHLLCSH